MPTRYSSGTGRWLGIGVLVLAVHALGAAFWYAHHRTCGRRGSAWRRRPPTPPRKPRPSMSSAPATDQSLRARAAWPGPRLVFQHDLRPRERIRRQMGRRYGRQSHQGPGSCTTIDTPELDDQFKAAEAKVVADNRSSPSHMSETSFADARTSDIRRHPKESCRCKAATRKTPTINHQSRGSARQSPGRAGQRRGQSPQGFR